MPVEIVIVFSEEEGGSFVLYIWKGYIAAGLSAATSSSVSRSVI